VLIVRVVGAHQPESGHLLIEATALHVARTRGSEPPIEYGFASPSTCGGRQWGKAVGLGLEKAVGLGLETAVCPEA
jgi:hypothetical protein